MEDEILRRSVLSFKNKEIDLRGMLLEIQEAKNGLNERDVFHLFNDFDIPLADIEKCVRESNDLEIKELNQNMIHLCTGNVCEYKRTQAIKDYVYNQKNFEVKEVPCCGMCSMGPIAIVNGESFIDINTNFGFKMALNKK